MKILSIDRSKCNGCGLCQSICSLAKKKQVQPKAALIQIRQLGGRETEYAAFCQHCEEPVCMSACLKDIISKDLITGRVNRNIKKCFECAACALMCPMNAVVHDNDRHAFDTCDLCSGDPVCVKVCPSRALTYGEPSEISKSIRNRNSVRFYAERRLL